MILFITFAGGTICGALMTWVVLNFPQMNRDGIASEETRVHLRSMRSPAYHWDAAVQYDAWGVPFIHHRANKAGASDITLHKDGKTSDGWLYGTEWRHMSGPPVEFGKPPLTPFAIAS
jgi:hypothetical protein